MIFHWMKNHTKIFFYNILHKTLIGSKPLIIRLDKKNGFIRAYDGTRYFAFFGAVKI